MTTATQTALAIVAFLGAVGGLAKVVHLIYRWARRMEGALTYVESEMKLNGGKTLRDSVRRIEHRLGIEPPDEEE